MLHYYLWLHSRFLTFLAHTTHFTEAGWTYLSHDSGGVGFMTGGGSYVSLISEDEQDLTIVIENIVSTDGLNDFDRDYCEYWELEWFWSRILWGLRDWTIVSTERLNGCDREYCETERLNYCDWKYCEYWEI